MFGGLRVGLINLNSSVSRTMPAARRTSKYFSVTAATVEPKPVAPRRSTRSAVLRATSATTDSSILGAESGSDLSYGSDIEDAVKSQSPSPPPARSARAATRKRKRTTTVTELNGSATKVKTESREASKAVSASVSKPTIRPDDRPPPPPRRVRKPARTTTDSATGAAEVSPPSDWEEMYAVAKEMRLRGPAAGAAVDTVGCERLAQPDASPRDRRFHTLVALMLSSQTKDTVNAEAMRRLKTEMPACGDTPGASAGLNLENMLAVDPALLNELIGKVGFHNNKTKYLKQAAEILRDKHNSDIPTTIEGLISLPGVGPKMAHLCMSADNGWGRVEGIGVDVHVHRITNLWGWQSPPTKTPEDTRRALEAWLPHDRWKEINWLLVGLGQAICLPVGRKCGDCELGLRGLCKAAERKKVTEGRNRRKREEEEKNAKGEEVEVEVKEAEEEAVTIKTE